MKNLKDMAKPYYSKSSHRWEHVERVHSLAMLIGAEKGADLSILKPAAYFHDCKKDAQHEGTVECHAEAGAQEVRTVLVEPYSAEDINKIAYCISVHRFKQNIPAVTLEGKILQDADRLDRIGKEAVTSDVDYLERAGTSPYTTEKGFTILTKIYKKKLMLKPETFNTETACKLAEERYRYTKDFMDNIAQIWAEKTASAPIDSLNS